jgi:hypothetical protein
MAKAKAPARKPKARKLKAKFKLPAKFKITMNWVVLHPPPTSLEKCPRCEKPHKKLKPLKLKKPMEFFGPDGKPYGRASHWAQCPKTKEPIILFDRADVGQSVENLVMKQAVDDICKAEDAKFLSEIDSIVGKTKTTTKATSGEVLEKRGKWVKKKGKRGQEVWVPDPDLNPNPSRVEVKATLGPMQAWVYEPNAPGRMVPGTKAEAKAQRARVKAQEKAAKPAREAARKERKR